MLGTAYSPLGLRARAFPASLRFGLLPASGEKDFEFSSVGFHPWLGSLAPSELTNQNTTLVQPTAIGAENRKHDTCLSDYPSRGTREGLRRQANKSYKSHFNHYGSSSSPKTVVLSSSTTGRDSPFACTCARNTLTPGVRPRSRTR